jgi:hypothetical protein
MNNRFLNCGGFVALAVGLFGVWAAASPQVIRETGILSAIRGTGDGSCDCYTTSHTDCNSDPNCTLLWWKCASDPEINNKYCATDYDEEGGPIPACSGITCSPRVQQTCQLDPPETCADPSPG